jgi:hypothetical protein
MANSDPLLQVSLPILQPAVVTFAMLSTLIGVLYWLMQPLIIPNPGLNAYHPSPSLLVEPPQREAEVQATLTKAGL